MVKFCICLNRRVYVMQIPRISVMSSDSSKPELSSEVIELKYAQNLQKKNVQVVVFISSFGLVTIVTFILGKFSYLVMKRSFS